MTEPSDSDRSRSTVDRRRFIAAAGAAGVAGVAGCMGNGGGGGDGTTPGDGSGGSGGSGGGTTTGQNGESTVTLRVWSGNMTDEPANKKYWQNAIQRFNDQSNDVEVELRGVPYESQFKKIRAAIQADSGVPHLNEIGSRIDTIQAGELLRLKEQGLWGQSTISEKVTDGVLSLSQAWGQQVTGAEGKLVTWPLGLRPYMNVYRRDWLDAAGISPSDIPGTPENLDAGAPTWQGGGGDTFTMFEDLYSPMNGTDLASGDASPDSTGMKEGDEEILSHYNGQWGITKMGTVNNAGTHSILTTERARDVIRFQKEGIEQGYFHPNSINHGDEEVTTLLWSNKLGMCHVQDVSDLWSSFRQQLGDQTYLDNYTWGLEPKGPGSDGRRSVYSVTPVFAPFEAAYENQAQKDASVEFSDWFAASDTEPLQRTKKIGWVPIDPAIMTGDWFTQDELHTKFWNTMQEIVETYSISAQPAVQGASKIGFQIPRTMHQRIFQQGMSIEQATKLASEEINQILRDNGRYEPMN
ncbi:MAG: ABC transporter substrate-binding protein [Haloferacaceae archaeon]